MSNVNRRAVAKSLASIDLEQIGRGDPVAIHNAFQIIQRTINDALIDASLPSRWIRVPFDATAFTATTGTAPVWTLQAADQFEFSYMRDGDTLLVHFFADDTTVANGGGAAVTALNVRIPGGYQTAGTHQQMGWAYVIDPALGIEIPAKVEVDSTGVFGPTLMRVTILGGAAFANGVNTTTVRFVIAFRIAPPALA